MELSIPLKFLHHQSYIGCFQQIEVLRSLFPFLSFRWVVGPDWGFPRCSDRLFSEPATVSLQISSRMLLPHITMVRSSALYGREVSRSFWIQMPLDYGFFYDVELISIIASFKSLRHVDCPHYHSLGNSAVVLKKPSTIKMKLDWNWIQ